MASKPISFANRLQSGDEELAGAMSQSINVVVDGSGTVTRRPGISVYANAPATVVDSSGIDGLHTTLAGKLYATASASDKAYHLTSSGSVVFPQSISGRRRAVWAETEALLVFTVGSYLYKIVKDTGALSRLGGDPPQCSHVIANASRLLANDLVVDTTKVRYSNIAQGTVTYAGYEEWTPEVPGEAGFFTAEARPDPVVALAESTNDDFVFGSTNLQLFTSDPVFVFAPTNTREYGCVAPYSVTKVDQSFMWLDHRRRFVISDGRAFDDSVGAPIQAVIDGMATVSDCFGYRVDIGQIDCVVFTFPSEGRSFAFQKGSGWSQWQGWSAASNQFAPHKVLSAAYTPYTDSTVVGTTDGYVAKYDTSATTDLGDPIVASVTTGFLDRDSDRRKLCKAVFVTLRRGETLVAADEPVGWLSYADAPGQWRDRIPLHLGVADDTDPVIPLRSLGWYRRRQWKFEYSDAAAVSLVSVTEEYELLDS